MEKVFFPASVVVFGVSAAPTNLARNIILNLQRFGYKGAIYAVGKDGGEVSGVSIYPAVDAVPAVRRRPAVGGPAPVVTGREQCARDGEPEKATSVNLASHVPILRFAQTSPVCWRARAAPRLNEFGERGSPQRGAVPHGVEKSQVQSVRQ